MKQVNLIHQEDITVVESSTLQGSSKDGLKLRDIELRNTTSGYGRWILTEEINSSRQSGLIEVDVDPSLIDLAVGDVVKFSNTILDKPSSIIVFKTKADLL